MSNRISALLLISLLLVLPLSAITVSGEGDPSHIQLDSSRADRLDLDNNGDLDTVRVVYLLNTSSHYAEAAVEVIVASGGMSLTFWDNVTLNRTTPHFGSIDVEAWADGLFDVRIKVWDAESDMLVDTNELGEHDLKAHLYPPYLRFDLVAAPTILLGDDCIIERVFLDEIGERYDALGIISLSGTPWLVSEGTEDIDCSSWPARDYHLSMYYRNNLGFSTQAELDFTIHTLPPPGFTLNVTGQHGQVGSECTVTIEPLPGTSMAATTIHWDITDPRGEPISMPGFSSIDCRLWQVGLTKVRVNVLSSEGQSTMGAYNLVRLPPSTNAPNEVLNASGASEMWPDRSLGADHEPVPFIGDTEVIAQSIVFIIGAVAAVILGLLGGMFWTRDEEAEEHGYFDSEAEAPDPEGLPSYADPSGIHWRQHEDGNVDWFDTVSGQWVAYEDV